MDLVGNLFWMYVAVSIASPQNRFSNFRRPTCILTSPLIIDFYVPLLHSAAACKGQYIAIEFRPAHRSFEAHY